MAHFDTRNDRPQSIDRAALRAARTWRDLAIAATGMVIVPALLIGLLAVVEAALPRAEVAGNPVPPQPWRDAAHRPNAIETA